MFAMEKNVGRKTGYIDILMVSLAVFSILFVIVDLTIDLPENQRTAFGWIDLGIVCVFWVEFSFKLVKSKARWLFVKRSWTDIIGMIPVTEITFAFIRVFRLFRIARILRIARVTRIGRVTRVTKTTKLVRISKFEKVARYTRKLIKRFHQLIKH